MQNKPTLSVFWVDVNKIDPNPYQPRKDFSEVSLLELSNSIRQYGVLQPLVVTKNEEILDDGSINIRYELIAGERRLRASKLANIPEVPVVIREGEEEDRLKLEFAIIENLHREDLNPVDRALAFKTLMDDFHLKQTEIAIKVGRSREFVSNSMRLLALPEEIINVLRLGKISEGHARSLLMLSDKKEEQLTLFNDILFRGLTVRDTERLARKNAQEKVRKTDRNISPVLLDLENKLSSILDADVHIENRGNRNKLIIDFDEKNVDKVLEFLLETKNKKEESEDIIEKTKQDKLEDEDDLYSYKNFSL